MIESLTEDVALDWLEAAAADVPSHEAIVELGVHQGASLARLAAGARDGFGASVVGIDPWGIEGAYPDRPHMQSRYTHRDYEACVEHLHSLDLHPHLIVGFGASEARVWSGPNVGLLFIDAVHTADAVLEDFAAWERHLSPGAIVAFDDYEAPRFAGVVAAVDSLSACGRIGPVSVVGARLAWAVVG